MEAAVAEAPGARSGRRETPAAPCSAHAGLWLPRSVGKELHVRSLPPHSSQDPGLPLSPEAPRAHTQPCCLAELAGSSESRALHPQLHLHRTQHLPDLSL